MPGGRPSRVDRPGAPAIWLNPAAMKAFVSGCAGFIGSHLTESLLADGHTVLGVDAFTPNYDHAQKLSNLARAQASEAFELVTLDLAEGDLGTLVDGCDVIFHLAAEPGVRNSWGATFAPYVKNNITALQNLLEAARRQPERRFVYASSSSIYGQASRFPTSEDVEPAPFSPYGVTKLAGEHLCGAYRMNFGLDVVALRYFTVYGPRQRPDMAFNIFSHRLLRGEAIELFGGDQTRDFTYVSDIVAATRSAGATQGLGGRAFNIGGGSSVSLGDVVDLLGEVAGERPLVRRVQVQHGDVRDTSADIGAAREALGYNPSVAVAEGLKAEWEWVSSSSARVDEPAPS